MDCRRFMADNPNAERAQVAVSRASYGEVALTCFDCESIQQEHYPTFGVLFHSKDAGSDTHDSDSVGRDQDGWMEIARDANDNDGHNCWTMVMDQTSYEVAMMATSLDDDNPESETDNAQDCESNDSNEDDLFEKSSSDGVTRRLPNHRRSIIQVPAPSGIRMRTCEQLTSRHRTSDGDRDDRSLAYMSNTSVTRARTQNLEFLYPNA